MIQCYVADGPWEGRTVALKDEYSFVVPRKDLRGGIDWSPEVDVAAISYSAAQYVVYRWRRVWFSGQYWVGKTVWRVASTKTDPEAISELVATSGPAAVSYEARPCPSFLHDFGAWWRWQCIDKGVTQDRLARAEIEAFERARDHEVAITAA